MTTYTIIFPHRPDVPISVLRHNFPPDYLVTSYTIYRASLSSVLRLVRLATNKPRLIPHLSGVALEVVVEP